MGIWDSTGQGVCRATIPGQGNRPRGGAEGAADSGGEGAAQGGLAEGRATLEGPGGGARAWVGRTGRGTVRGAGGAEREGRGRAGQGGAGTEGRVRLAARHPGGALLASEPGPGGVGDGTGWRPGGVRRCRGRGLSEALYGGEREPKVRHVPT
ncbi:hypothetical protein GCM10017687_18840 [Streptomyces echinatus]